MDYFVLAKVVLAIIFSYVFFKIARYCWRFLGLPNSKKEVYFKDYYNRIKIYRGVNVCNYSKAALDLLPWHTEQDYARLKDWGFNLVRFLVFWEAIEPEKDKYNFDYLNKVKKHIKTLEKLGIDVIIDIHQDLYSRKFTGDGFPNWTLPEEKHTFKTQTPWWKNYFTPAVLDCYKHFWKNKDLKNKYVELVEVVSEIFIDCRNVIGIDVFNEPFPNFPFIWRFEKKYLNKFYTQIKQAVICKPLFFESWILTSAGTPTKLNPKLFSARHFHIPHYYPPFCNGEGDYNKFNRLLTRISLKAKAIEAKRLNCPVIIGETGISPSVKNYTDFIEDLIELSNKYKINWLWYCYDKETHSSHGLLDVDGKEREFVSNLVTIYPQRIAGANPEYYIKDNVFYFKCDYDVSVTGTTNIFVPDKFNYEVKTDLDYVIKDNIIEFEQARIMEIEIKFSLKQ